MKINGKKIAGPNTELIIIPRGEGEDIVLKAQAILDFAPFHKMMPQPKPPKKRTKDGLFDNMEDPRFKQAIIEHSEKRMAWMILKSLEATPELEWEMAKIEDSNTWHLYNEELLISGFSDIEISRIINGVMAANCLDEVKMEEARKRFLASQVKPVEELSSLKAEQDSSLFGVPANGLASALPV